MHLDEERLQRLVHGELSAPAERSAREHLVACMDCRQRVFDAEWEEDRVDALLRELDHPAPPVRAQSIAARAGARPTSRVPTWDHGLLRWAAGFLLAVGFVGAAYAMPGSPLKVWVRGIAGWIAERRAPSPHVPEPTSEPGAAGVAIAPGRNLIVLFTTPRVEGRVRVSLGDGSEVVVRSPIGAATYTSDAERLVIDNRGPASSFEIEIPRAAPRVEIQVAGDRILLKDGPAITTPRSADATGSYLLSLTRTGS